jgi:hypothetical protein
VPVSSSGSSGSKRVSVTVEQVSMEVQQVPSSRPPRLDLDASGGGSARYSVYLLYWTGAQVQILTLEARRRFSSSGSMSCGYSSGVSFCSVVLVKQVN